MTSQKLTSASDILLAMKHQVSQFPESQEKGRIVALFNNLLDDTLSYNALIRLTLMIKEWLIYKLQAYILLEHNYSSTHYSRLAEHVGYGNEFSTTLGYDGSALLIPNQDCQFILSLLWLLKACHELKRYQQSYALLRPYALALNAAPDIFVSNHEVILSEENIVRAAVSYGTTPTAFARHDVLSDFEEGSDSGDDDRVTLLNPAMRKESPRLVVNIIAAVCAVVLESVVAIAIAAVQKERENHTSTQLTALNNTCTEVDYRTNLSPLLFNCMSNNQTYIECCGIQLASDCSNLLNNTLLAYTKNCRSVQTMTYLLYIALVVFTLIGACFIGAALRNLWVRGSYTISDIPGAKFLDNSIKKIASLMGGKNNSDDDSLDSFSDVSYTALNDRTLENNPEFYDTLTTYSQIVATRKTKARADEAALDNDATIALQQSLRWH